MSACDWTELCRPNITSQRRLPRQAHGMPAESAALNVAPASAFWPVPRPSTHALETVETPTRLSGIT